MTHRILFGNNCSILETGPASSALLCRSSHGCTFGAWQHINFCLLLLAIPLPEIIRRYPCFSVQGNKGTLLRFTCFGSSSSLNVSVPALWIGIPLLCNPKIDESLSSSVLLLLSPCLPAFLMHCWRTRSAGWTCSHAFRRVDGVEPGSGSFPVSPFQQSS